MKKIGIFLDEITDSSIPESEKLAKLGNNTGNMLFWESLKANLNLEVIPRRYINDPQKLDLSRFSAFVTTDLIWIRQMQDLSYLNKTLDAIGGLPLIPISIGLQCDRMIPDFRLHPETVRVIRRISERCVMGVRGDYTAEILRRYGIDNFTVIGCPSMYMDTAGLLSVGTEKKSVGRVSANFETFYKKLDKPRLDFLRYCAENDFSFAEQTAASVSEKQIGDPLLLKNVQSWLGKNSHRFFDINEWRSYIRGFDLSIGARFHGNVIALWENVPALFLVTDSRTKELCEHFALPHIDIGDFDRSKPVEYYYGLADYSEFHKNYPKRVGEWKEFLKVNGLNIRKKVLYVCYFPTAFIQSYTYQCAVNSGAEAYVMLPNGFKRENRLDEVFSKVIYLDGLDNIHFYDDENAIEKQISEYYDEVLKENGILLDELDEIFVACDMTNDFAIYLSLKQKEYYFCEIATDQLNNNRVGLYDYHINNENVHGSSAYFRTAKKHLSICGTSPLCRKRFIYTSSVGDPECAVREERIDYPAMMPSFSANEKAVLVDCFDRFDIRKYCEAANGSTMLLTERQWKYPVSLEETGLLYQYFCDYFCEGEFISINPHPSDKYSHKDFFEDSVVFPVGFPADLFPLVDGFKIKKAITIASTAIQHFSYWCDDLITCGDSYYRNRKNINKIYFSVRFISEIGYGNGNIFRNNIPDGDEFLGRIRELALKTDMNETQWLSLSSPFNGAALVGNVVFDDKYLSYDKYYAMLKDLPSDSVIFFLDFENERNFIDSAHSEFLNDIYTFRISKEKVKEKIYCGCDDEYFYVFCKDKSKIEALLRGKHKKELKNVGICLTAKYDAPEAASCGDLSRDKAAEDIRLNTDPFSQPEIYNKLLVTEELIRLFSEHTVSCYGISENFINDFYLNTLNRNYNVNWCMPAQLPSNAILIIDALNIGKGTPKEQLSRIINDMADNSVFVFLSRDIKHFWSLQLNSVTDYCVPVKIAKTRIRSAALYNDFNDEHIWIFTKNKEYRSKIRSWSAEMLLKQVGIKIEALPYSESETALKLIDVKLNSISDSLIGNV